MVDLLAEYFAEFASRKGLEIGDAHQDERFGGRQRFGAAAPIFDAYQNDLVEAFDPFGKSVNLFDHLARRAAYGIMIVSGSRIIWASLARLTIPAAVTIPNSDICARNALAAWLRWRISKSRVLRIIVSAQPQPY